MYIPTCGGYLYKEANMQMIPLIVIRIDNIKHVANVKSLEICDANHIL
jgi:hypothetical protein